MNTTARIDFDAIAARYDLRRVVRDDLGAPLKGNRHACPFHNGENPNFDVSAKRAHCFKCGWGGDVVDYLVGRDGITKVEAARRLAPDLFKDDASAKRKTSGARKATSLVESPRPIVNASSTERHAEPPDDPQWQAIVTSAIEQAEKALWGPSGRRALGWLRGRGLADRTIRRFRLGFIGGEHFTQAVEILGPSVNGQPRGIHVARGVTIPWVAPGSTYDAPKGDPPRWIGCNVRRLAEDFSDPSDGDKCRALAGSRRGRLYPFADIETPQEGMAAVLVEGEFDALIGHQEAGHLAVFGTVGGAEQRPHPTALEALSRCPTWIVATDHDAAGGLAFWRWHECSEGRAHRALLPHDKDLNAFHKAGGDVRGWLASELVKVKAEPPDWREAVADASHEQWVAWRQRSGEILAGYGPDVTVADIRLANGLAYRDVFSPKEDAHVGL